MKSIVVFPRRQIGPAPPEVKGEKTSKEAEKRRNGGKFFG